MDQNLIDPRTIVLMTATVGAVLALVFALLQRVAEVPGLRSWEYGLWIMSASGILFALKDYVPNFFSITLPNALTLLGLLLYLDGSHRHFGVRMHWRRWAVAGTACAAVAAWYIHADDVYRMRVIFIIGMCFAVSGYHAWLMLREVMEGQRRPTLGLVFTASWLVILTIVFALRWSVGTFFPILDVSLFSEAPVQLVYIAARSLSLIVVNVGLVLMVSEWLRARLEHEATHDSLTNALGRGALLDELHREWTRCKRYNRTLTLMMLDLDHFKQINDRYGHTAGDRVLQQFTRNVSGMLRPNDIFGRYGGEEFMIVMPETDEQSAVRAAERFRLAAKAPRDPALPAFSVSIGVTQFKPSDETEQDLINRADQALYVCKQNGRDRVETL